jgi:hypothetical protein
MGIADQIRNTIQAKLVLKFCPSQSINEQTASCVICNSKYVISRNFSIFLPDEGYVCYECGEKFAPEMTLALNRINQFPIKNQDSTVEKSRERLSTQEWNQIYETLDTLRQVSMDLIKGLSRGIVEAPAGHIGLLHFAKDLVRPVRKEGESEKEYQLRVKTYRIQKIFEKLKIETVDRINTLQEFFIRLGMPVSNDRES